MKRAIILSVLILANYLYSCAQVNTDTTKISAVQDSVTAINLMPSQEAELAYNSGIEKMKIGDYKTAIEHFDEALKLKPDWAKAFFNRAVAKKEKKMYQAAIEDFEKCSNPADSIKDVLYNNSTNPIPYNNFPQIRAKQSTIEYQFKRFINPPLVSDLFPNIDSYKDLPTKDWVHQFPDFTQSNYRMTSQFDINASKIDAKKCMDGWFVKSMPDLNQSNPLVLNYLIQNAIWWIEYADLDGFRVDTYPYADKTALATWTKAITDEYPYFNITAEAWLYSHAQISYWQKDSKISAIQSYNSHCPNVMDFMLHAIIEKGVFNEEKNTWNEGLIKIYDSFASDFLYPDSNNLLVFAENHDTQRLNHVYSNIKNYKLAMALLATIRGIPQIYYGSEIGMAGSKNLNDGDIRRDFPGGWKDDANNAFTSSGRTEIQKQYYDFSAKLFNWRKTKSVIHSGKTTHYIPENNVYVYFRHNDAESVMVIINNSLEKQTIQTSRFNENIQNFKSGTDALTNAIFDVKNEISIDGKSVLILELK